MVTLLFFLKKIRYKGSLNMGYGRYGRYGKTTNIKLKKPAKVLKVLEILNHEIKLVNQWTICQKDFGYERKNPLIVFCQQHIRQENTALYK